VGDDREAVEPFLSRGVGQNNSLLKPRHQAPSMQVPTVCYEDAVRGASVVKIDVEGAEYGDRIVQPSIPALIIDFHNLAGSGGLPGFRCAKPLDICRTSRPGMASGPYRADTGGCDDLSRIEPDNFQGRDVRRPARASAGAFSHHSFETAPALVMRSLRRLGSYHSSFRFLEHSATDVSLSAFFLVTFPPESSIPIGSIAPKIWGIGRFPQGYQSVSSHGVILLTSGFDRRP
jgi:hypothetical protein